MTSPHTAWNLLFATENGVAPRPGGSATFQTPTYAPSGWVGHEGPGIAWQYWPRSAATGLPMMHVITLVLPAEYRRKGEQYPAISFFAGEGQFAPEPIQGDGSSADPFLRDLAAAIEHPALHRRRDLIDGEFALLWLSVEEVAAGPTAPSPDLRAAGTWTDDSEGCNAWDERAPRADVWLVPRTDPNAGIVPQEFSDDEPAIAGYSNPFDAQSNFQPWAEPLLGMSHLGGTTFPVQGLPDGLTPWYLELEEIVGLNFGGDGNAQIDLESDTFDWACG